MGTKIVRTVIIFLALAAVCAVAHPTVQTSAETVTLVVPDGVTQGQPITVEMPCGESATVRPWN